MRNRLFKQKLTIKSLRKTAVLLLLILLLVNYYEHFKVHQFNAHIESNGYYLSDSLAGHIHSPNYSINIDWPESEMDSFQMKTNNLGFREDNTTNKMAASNTRRIFITGDSHTDGVLSNVNSFPNVLESHLNELSNGQRYEIINGGHGFYSFKNYYGILEKFKYLDPDDYIITVYLGNDFIENLFYEGDNLGVISSPSYTYYRLKKKYIKAITGIENSQFINQAIFFDTFPSKIDQTIDITGDYISKIQAICLEQHINLKVIILPSALEIDRNFINQIKGSYWHNDVMNTNTKIKNRFIELLTQKEVFFCDLTDDFYKSKKNLYWKTDNHLNADGHRLTAKLIDQLIE